MPYVVLKETDKPGPSGADFLIWADGTWCSAYELPQYQYMSDDYQRLRWDSVAWHEFNDTLG